MPTRIDDLLNPKPPTTPSEPRSERPRISLRKLVLDALSENRDWAFQSIEMASAVSKKLPDRKSDPRLLFGPTTDLFEETQGMPHQMVQMWEETTKVLEALYSEGIVEKNDSKDPREPHYFLKRIDASS